MGSQTTGKTLKMRGQRDDRAGHGMAPGEGGYAEGGKMTRDADGSLNVPWAHQSGDQQNLRRTTTASCQREGGFRDGGDATTGEWKLR